MTGPDQPEVPEVPEVPDVADVPEVPQRTRFADPAPSDRSAPEHDPELAPALQPDVAQQPDVAPEPVVTREPDLVPEVAEPTAAPVVSLHKGVPPEDDPTLVAPTPETSPRPTAPALPEPALPESAVPEPAEPERAAPELREPGREPEAPARAVPDLLGEPIAVESERPAASRGVLVPVLAAVVLVLAGLTGFLGYQLSQTPDQASSQASRVQAGADAKTAAAVAASSTEALATARKAATLVFSYDYRKLAKDFAAGRATTTGGFQQEYDRTTKRLVDDFAVRLCRRGRGGRRGGRRAGVGAGGGLPGVRQPGVHEHRYPQAQDHAEPARDDPGALGDNLAGGQNRRSLTPRNVGRRTGSEFGAVANRR